MKRRTRPAAAGRGNNNNKNNKAKQCRNIYGHYVRRCKTKKRKIVLCPNGCEKRAPHSAACLNLLLSASGSVSKSTNQHWAKCCTGNWHRQTHRYSRHMHSHPHSTHIHRHPDRQSPQTEPAMHR